MTISVLLSLHLRSSSNLIFSQKQRAHDSYLSSLFLRQVSSKRGGDKGIEARGQEEVGEEEEEEEEKEEDEDKDEDEDEEEEEEEK